MRIKYIVCVWTVYKCWIMYEYAGRIYVYLLGWMEWLDMCKRYWWLCWSMRKRCNMHRFGKRLSLCLCQRFHRFVFFSFTFTCYPLGCVFFFLFLSCLKLYLFGYSITLLICFAFVVYLFHFFFPPYTSKNSICNQLASIDKWICENENGTWNGGIFAR